MKIKTLLNILLVLVFSIVINTENNISYFILQNASYLIGDFENYESRSISVSQNFSIPFENYDDNGFFFPVKEHIITSKYGERVHPITGEDDFHNGIDLVSLETLDVFAIDDGTVLDSGYDDSYGNFVLLSHKDGYTSLYSHLDSFFENDEFKKGDVIGVMGDTGFTTGVHLHLEIAKNGETFDPLECLYEY